MKAVVKLDGQNKYISRRWYNGTEYAVEYSSLRDAILYDSLTQARLVASRHTGTSAMTIREARANDGVD